MPNDQFQLNGGQQGSGSGLDADQIDGSQPGDLPIDGFDPGNLGSGEFLKFDGSNLVGGTVETLQADGESIIEENGVIQLPATVEIIGDFESDFGSWSKVNNSGSEVPITRTNYTAKRGSYSIEVDATTPVTDGTSRDGIESTFDFTDVKSVLVSYKVEEQGGDQLSPSAEVQNTSEGTIYIISETITSGSTSWRTAEADVSNVTGSHNLFIYIDTTNDGAYATQNEGKLFIDDIRLKLESNEVITVTSEAGN